jgi:glucose/arabinose dehydrogenase
MHRYATFCLTLLAASCAAPADRDTGVGSAPVLPAAQRSAVPTVDIAPAEGWPAGETPVAAQGLRVTPFATGLDHPRWLLVLPNGDVLVAESNGPAGKSGIRGLKGVVMKRVMAKAGAGAPSADRITLLRDADGDGVAELKAPFATGLHSPFGMALVGQTLYVANADALVATDYTPGTTRAGAFRSIVPLPGKGDELNHHWTKSLLAAHDGRYLYVGVGSNSNVAENGMAVEKDRAAILRIDPATRQATVFASGLRNPVGMAWEPETRRLWAVVNERDELGNNLVPDYLTSVVEGGFYGWPWYYWGGHRDARVPLPHGVPQPLRPDYGLGNHVAPLGLAFANGRALGAGYTQGAFVGLHGSWNRKPLNGYKVVFVPFQNGRPSGQPMDVLGGFLTTGGKARGRPVGVALHGDGLLVADDVGNAVWRVRKAARP